MYVGGVNVDELVPTVPGVGLISSHVYVIFPTPPPEYVTSKVFTVPPIHAV